MTRSSVNQWETDKKEYTKQRILQRSSARAGGWGGTRQSFILGGSAPMLTCDQAFFFLVSQTKNMSNPLPFYISFLTDKLPVSHTFYWQMIPLPRRMPGLELCLPLNCCKCIVFKIWINHKTRTFSRLFHTHKTHLLALLGLSTDRQDKFPYSFIYFNKWDPFPFIYLKPE